MEERRKKKLFYQPIRSRLSFPSSIVPICLLFFWFFFFNLHKIMCSSEHLVVYKNIDLSRLITICYIMIHHDSSRLIRTLRFTTFLRHTGLYLRPGASTVLNLVDDTTVWLRVSSSLDRPILRACHHHLGVDVIAAFCYLPENSIWPGVLRRKQGEWLECPREVHEREREI